MAIGPQCLLSLLAAGQSPKTNTCSAGTGHFLLFDTDSQCTSRQMNSSSAITVPDAFSFSDSSLIPRASEDSFRNFSWAFDMSH